MNTDIKQRIAEWHDEETSPAKATETLNLLRDCLKHIEEMERQIARLKRHKPKRHKGPKIHIILDGKSTMIDCNDQWIAHGSGVRAALPFDQMRYTILREGNPDEVITDTMPVYTGDKLHTIPPCYGA